MNKSTLLALFLLFTCFSGTAQLKIENSYDKYKLSGNLKGKGVIIQNTKLNCNQNGAGLFTDGLSSTGFSNGILLTTCYATDMEGPNDNTSWTRNAKNNFVDTNIVMIDSLAIKDVCLLEFDALVAGDSLSLDFFFGSEEYPEYCCCKFNDAIGIFMSGPGISGSFYSSFSQAGAINLAVIPGTGEPVSVNNVSGYSCSETGLAKNNKCLSYANTSIDPPCCKKNIQHYVENGDGSVSSTYPNGNYLQLDGYTKPIVSSVPVYPGETYHMKLIIADAGDYRYDSGIFFKGNSLKSKIMDGIIYQVKAVCEGDSIKIAGKYRKKEGFFYTTYVTAHGDSTVLTELLFSKHLVKMSSIIPDSLCNNDPSINLSGSYPDGGVYSGIGVTNSTFNPFVADTGTHTLFYTYTDSIGCSFTDSAHITVTQCLGKDELKMKNNLVIYPQPANQKIILRIDLLKESALSFNIFDLHGKLIYSTAEKKYTTGAHEITVDTGSFPSGSYLLVMYNGEKTYTKELLINRPER